MSRLFPLLKHFSMRALPWLLSALAASAVTVGAMLPAAWFTPAVARITHNRVHLTAPSGSVWRGSAMLMFSAGAHAVAPTVLPERIEWRTAFWPLLADRIQLSLRADGAMPAPVALEIMRKTASLGAGRLSLPASIFTGLGAPFNTLGLKGEIQLECNRGWRTSRRSVRIGSGFRRKAITQRLNSQPCTALCCLKGAAAGAHKEDFPFRARRARARKSGTICARCSRCLGRVSMMNVMRFVSQGNLARLWPYIKPHLWTLGLAILSMGCAAASEAGIPALLKPLIDQGFGAHGPVQSLPWLIPLAVMGLALTRGAMQYAANYLLAYVSNRVLLDLRRAMFDRLLRARAAFFQRETASALINAVVFEVNQALTILSGVMITLVRDSLTALFLLGWLYFLNWRLTLVIALILPAIGGLMSRINRRLQRLNREHQRLTNQLSYIVEENVAGYKVVKVHHGESFEQRRFDAMSRRLCGFATRMTISGGLAQPLTQFLASIAFAIVLSMAMAQSAADQTTVGGFVSFVTAMLLIISPLKHLMDVNQPLLRGAAAAEMIFGLIDAPLEAPGGPRTLERARGKIEFRQACFSYPAANASSAHRTLDHISFTVAPGQVFALVGPSGGGKTTLINLLPRFFDPQQGGILLDGLPLGEYRLADLRRQIALVRQDVVLFNDSVAPNGANGAEAIDRQRVERALAAAYLMAEIRALPDGINALNGHNGMRLSGGQRQRLAIARAIYKDAPVLILDEATSALDAQSERHVQAALKRLMRGRTTLVIAHRLATAERADRILVLDAGRIVEQGPHAELLAKNGRYAQLYRLQFGSDRKLV